MNYLADTVTIVHHLRRPSKLGAVSRRILAETDKGELLIPVTVIDDSANQPIQD